MPGCRLQPCLRNPAASSSPPANIFVIGTLSCSLKPEEKEHFHHGLFHGFHADAAMLRIGSMYMLLQGIENPAINAGTRLQEDHAGEEEKYTSS